MEPAEGQKPTFLRTCPGPPSSSQGHVPICWTEDAAVRSIGDRHRRCSATPCRGATGGRPLALPVRRVFRKCKSSPQLLPPGIAPPPADDPDRPPPPAADYLLLPRTTDVASLTGTSRGGVFRSGWATAPPPIVAREQYLVYKRAVAPRRTTVWLPPSLLVGGEKADLEAKNTRKLYTDVLDTEHTFVKELEGLVARKEQLALRKKELLHKKWSESVYEPIRKQIDTQMHGSPYTDLVRRKRQQHKEYLEHVNRKGHVFLDTIDPDEYYAMSIHPTRPSAITAQTKPLKDPLLTQERDRTEEDRVIYQCSTGSALSEGQLRALRLPRLPLVPLGRHGTECHTWLEMPMGDIESPVRMASRHRFKSTTNDSQIDFPRWAKLQSRSNFVGEKLQIQRKRMYTEDCPNDRTRSNPTVTNNCGGPFIHQDTDCWSAPD